MQQFQRFFLSNNSPPDEILINFDLTNIDLIKKLISPNKSIAIKSQKKAKKLELREWFVITLKLTIKIIN